MRALPQRHEPLYEPRAGCLEAHEAQPCGQCRRIQRQLIRDGHELAIGQHSQQATLDQDSLPPDDTLDAILREYVEEDRSIAEITRMGLDEALVRRVARMVDVAEYKRRQSPPGIKITPRAFGSDRRLRITNCWRG